MTAWSAAEEAESHLSHLHRKQSTLHFHAPELSHTGSPPLSSPAWSWGLQEPANLSSHYLHSLECRRISDLDVMLPKDHLNEKDQLCQSNKIGYGVKLPCLKQRWSQYLQLNTRPEQRIKEDISDKECGWRKQHW